MQVTGFSFNASGQELAFLYSNGVMNSIGTPPGYQDSAGYGINDHGWITGVAFPEYTNQQHAFLYSNGVMRDLGTLPGGSISGGAGINDAGQITGSATDANGDNHAFLYSSGGTMMDLNSMIDRSSPLALYVTLIGGAAISANGFIVANGVNSRTNATHAYLVSPSSAGPNCRRDGNFAICQARPIISLCPGSRSALCQLVCNIQCLNNSLINWIPPVFGSVDPWLNGVSVSMLVLKPEQARSIATGLQVSISTEPSAQTISQRTARAELINHGAPRPQRVLVVGPLVDVAAVPDAAPATQALISSASHPIIELSLPYVASARSKGTNLRMVRFDDATGRWLDVGGQSVSAAKHLVTARVSAVGRFTIVAAGSRPPY